MTPPAVLIPSLSCRSQCKHSLSGGHYPVASLSGPYHGFNVLESQPVIKLELAEFVYKVRWITEHSTAVDYIAQRYI